VGPRRGGGWGYTAALTDGGQLRVETTAIETIINQKQASNLTFELEIHLLGVVTTLNAHSFNL